MSKEIHWNTVAKMENGLEVKRLGWPSLKAFFASINYYPHPGQKQFHMSMARNRVMCAGARFGKSIAAGYECAANIIIPKQRWWIVAEEYDLAEKEFRYIYQALLEHPDDAKRQQIKDMVESTATNSKIGQMWIKFKHGSFVIAKTAGRPTGLLGEELDGIIMAEGSQIPKWIMDRYIRQRLSSRVGQLLVPTTPCGYDDFLYPLFLSGQMKDYHYDGENYVESAESWEFKSIDNPYYPREDYDLAKRMLQNGSLSEADFGEQYEGRFTSNTGLVYKNFNHQVHVIDPIPEEEMKEWPCFRTVDVGMDAPTVCLVARVDSVGAIVITDEYYESGADVAEHSKNIIEMTGDRDVRYTMIDPAASQRTAANSRSALMQYIEHGIPCIPADNSVDAGIMRVSDYLKYDRDDDNKITMPPKLFITRDCPNLIEEFGKYVWARRKDGTKTNKPVKRNDHGLDSLRYLCMSRPYYGYRAESNPTHPDSFDFMMERDKRSRKMTPEFGAV